MTYGRFVFLALLIVLVSWIPRWMPQGPERTAPQPDLILQSPKELRAGLGASATAKAVALQRMLREAEQKRGSLTPEQIALIDELKAARGDASKSRVAEKLIQTLEQKNIRPLSFYEWAADAWLSIQSAYERFQPTVRSWLWILTVMIVGTAVTAAMRSRISLARSTAGMAFGLSRGWLVILSLLAMALTMFTRTNPWPTFPSELILLPIVALIGSALALRIVDLNYPVWNSLVRGCGSPLISMAFIAVFLKLV